MHGEVRNFRLELKNKMFNVGKRTLVFCTTFLEIITEPRNSVDPVPPSFDVDDISAIMRTTFRDERDSNISLHCEMQRAA